MSITVLYLALCAAVLWIAALSHETDRRHARQIAMALTFSCALSNSTWITGNWWTWPVLDAVLAWFVAIRYRMRPRPWKLAIVVLVACAECCHIGWKVSGGSDLAAYGYTASLNSLFVAQLACVASTGVGRVRDRLRDALASRLNRVGGWRSFVLRRRGRIS